MFRALCTTTGLLTLLTSPVVLADSGGLSIAPVRVELNDTHPTQTLSLTNKSTDSLHYVVNFEDQVMDDYGVVSKKDDFAYSAKRMLRMSPQDIILKPGEHQNIRIMAVVPSGTPDGSYHTHMIFNQKFDLPRDTSATEAGFSASVATSYSVGIPAVVNHGKINARMVLESAKLVEKNKRPQLEMVFKRYGNGESMGMLSLRAGISTTSLTPETRVRMYHEVDQITVRQPLHDPSMTMQSLQGLPLEARFDTEGKTQAVSVTLLP